MSTVHNEKLKRKLAIFYHPLFQTVVHQYSSAFQAPQNLFDFAIFTEINLRAQKIILTEFDAADSLSSALTDWAREIENLSNERPERPFTPSATSVRPKREDDLIRPLKKLIEKVPFDLALPQQAYLDFFHQQEGHIDSHLIIDKISLQGFGKFLFDLCLSWCEDLDVELFCLFSLAVLYQLTYFINPTQLRVLPFNKVESFIDPLLTQIKLVKAHFQRYKKVDLTTYESFYEWNYLPNRLKEIKAKLIELFVLLPHDQRSLHSHIEVIYKTSAYQIMHKNLSKPTTAHFTVLIKENQTELKSILGPNEPTPAHFPEHVMNSLANSTQQRLTPTKKHVKIMKKAAMPVIGKTISKIFEQNDIGKIHTIKNIETFMEDGGEDSPIASRKSLLQKNTKLYPIWEHETSEAASMATTQNFDNQKMLAVANKGLKMGSKSIERALKVIARTQKEDNTTPKNPHSYYRQGSRRKIVEDFSKSSQQSFVRLVNSEGRASVSPKLFNIKRTAMQLPEDVCIKNEEELRIDNKLNMILNDKMLVRTPTPNHRASHRKMVLSNMGLSNVSGDLIEDVNSLNSIKSVRVVKYNGSASENVLKASSNPTSTRNKPKITEARVKRMGLTIVGKPGTGQLSPEEEQNMSGSLFLRDKSTIEVEERPIKIRKPERYIGHPTFGRATPVGISSRMTPVNDGRISNMSLDADRPGNLEGLRETGRFVFTKTFSAKPVSINIKEALNEFVSKKDNTKDLFDRMKQKVEKNKKVQDIRMKKLVRSPRKNGQSLGGLPAIDKKRLETFLTTELFKNDGGFNEQINLKELL